MRKFVLAIGIFAMACLEVNAQDPHFSMFYSSPLTTNPALTGVFPCNYRFTSIYRGQWQSVLRSNPYDVQGTSLFRTFSSSFELKTNQGFGSADAFAAGLVVMSDQAGAANFGSNGASLSVSYIKSLNGHGRTATNFLSIGIQGGVVQRHVSTAQLCFGTHFDGEGCNRDLPQDPGVLAAFDDNFIFYDASIGILWFMQTRERFDIYIGAAVHHLNTPDESFFEDNLTVEARVPMKYTGHAGLQIPITGQFEVAPKAIFLMQGKQWENNVGVDARFLFDSRNPYGNAFSFGPMYRIVGGDASASGWVDENINSESLILNAKLNYNNMEIGVAYDINTGEASSASRSIGGFEVAFAYTGCFSRKGPKTLFCPRF